MSHIFNDSKYFVDMPLLLHPRQVIADYNSLPDHSKHTLLCFVSRNFGKPGSDIEDWLPPDFSSSPSFLNRIKDIVLKQWASDVHSLWKMLGRKIKSSVYIYPERHTLLGLKEPYMIVPGGRFREFCKLHSLFVVVRLFLANHLFLLLNFYFLDNCEIIGTRIGLFAVYWCQE